MEAKKNLRVDCATCDVRGITEELLSRYGKVEINAAVIVTNRTAQTLLSGYRVQLNCANVWTLDEDVRFSSFNGSVTISPTSAVPAEKTFLMLNGRLDIESGSEEALKGYAAIVVNGAVSCPKSIADQAGGILTVNGSFNTYPDGCIRLKNTAVLDRFFHLRAKQDASYYAAKRIVALSPDINFAKLAEKNVRFVTRKLLVAESLAEAAVPFFDESADIAVMPDGCAYVDGDAVLDEALLKRCGGSLYVTGDLTVPAGAAGLLDQVACLRVDGDLLVSRSLKDKVLAMDVEYGDFYVVGGTILANRSSDQITAYMLRHAEDGLSALNCTHVSIAADVSPELLREKLASLINCTSVTCASEEQAAVVSLMSRNVASITLEGREDGDGETEEDEDTVCVETAFYTF